MKSNTETELLDLELDKWFKELESQMCSFTGNNVKSQHDDRVDALVWAITSLQSSGQAVYRIT